jgi:hypothetical protein
MVTEAGIDTGYAPNPHTLRAPDIAIGNVPNEPGWVEGVPPLAIEYADTGQDEKELREKIDELLSAGTKLIWVVRLKGARLVEVYEAGKAMRRVMPGGVLLAPGILKNPVPVEALYDPKASEDAAFRNLLERHGYKDLESVREEGIEAGMEKGLEKGASAFRRVIRQSLSLRAISLSKEQSDALDACTSLDTLEAWANKATSAASADDIFSE